jgi:hypothetical protein
VEVAQIWVAMGAPLHMRDGVSNLFRSLLCQIKLEGSAHEKDYWRGVF